MIAASIIRLIALPALIRVAKLHWLLVGLPRLDADRVGQLGGNVKMAAVISGLVLDVADLVAVGVENLIREGVIAAVAVLVALVLDGVGRA